METDRDDMDDGMEELGEDLFGEKGAGLGEADEDSPQDAEEGSRKAPGAVREAGAGKKTWKTVTSRQKAINVILRRAGKDKAPELKQILSGKWGTQVKIKDIGIFISDEQDDELMAEVVKDCPVRNRINLSAEVAKKRVLDIGSQIVEAGKMYQPISVAKVKEDGRLECTSGRHRLVFLAVMYGADVRIPVYVEEMTLNEARDAVVVSNQARPTKARERAEHTVLQAVKGNLDAAQDELYDKTVTKKARAKRYCLFSVVNRSYPMKLSFQVSKGSSRSDGGVTTFTNIENFWGAALCWTEGTARKDFDAALKASVRFLNALVAGMQSQKGFDAKQHLAAMALTAVGKYYRGYGEAGADAISVVDDVAKCIVRMGECGRHKSEKIYAAIVKELPLPRKK
jgi:hypothetical protein